MKKSLLIFFLAASSAIVVHAQSRMSSKLNKTRIAQQRNSMSAKTMAPVCDSLTNFQSTYSFYIFPLGTDSGYVSGQNIYGDISKAEKIAIPVANSVVIGIGYYFG